MICPHCNKPIETARKNEKLKKKVLKLAKQGYSLRDIEALTNRQVSFSTASRWIREKKEREAKGK